MRMNWSETTTTKTTKQQHYIWVDVDAYVRNVNCEIRITFRRRMGFQMTWMVFFCAKTSAYHYYCVCTMNQADLLCVFFHSHTHTLIQFYQLWLSNELNLEMQQSNKQTNNKHNETTFSFNCKTIAYEILAAKWRCTHNSSKYDFHPSNNRINNNINNIHCEQSNRFNGSTELYRISLSLS